MLNVRLTFDVEQLKVARWTTLSPCREIFDITIICDEEIVIHEQSDESCIFLSAARLREELLSGIAGLAQLNLKQDESNHAHC